MESGDLLESFTEYCKDRPSERFWQALRNWSGHNFILAGRDKADPRSFKDTFYWHARNGMSRSVDAE